MFLHEFEHGLQITDRCKIVFCALQGRKTRFFEDFRASDGRSEAVFDPKKSSRGRFSLCKVAVKLGMCFWVTQGPKKI